MNLLSKRWCNLVFENRNKDYGAYILRRNAGKMLTRALVIVLVLFVLVVVMPLVFVKWQIKQVEKNVMNTIANMSKLEQPKIKRLHELKAVDITQRIRAKKEKDAIRFVPNITDNDEADSQLLLGTQNVGADDDSKASAVVNDSSIIASDTSSAVIVASRLLSPLDVVEEMPQFPGGLSALMKWLDKNVVYPPVCIRNKVEGRVEVSFLINKSGDIINPTISKALHPLLDREAIFAIKKMPKWMPGKVGGRVSVVRITIPIEFSTH